MIGTGELQGDLDVVGDDWIIDAFHTDLTDLFRFHEIADPAERSLAHEDLPGFGKRFQPGGHIDLIADHGVVFMEIRSDIADRHVPGVFDHFPQ